MHTDVLLLTLRVFSATGGIEKVCKVLSKALTEILSLDTHLKSNATGINRAAEKKCLSVYSMYDEATDADEKYIDKERFKGFGQQKLAFAKAAIRKGRESKIVVLSHINLLSVGYIIKLLSPNTTLVLFAHGIEVWDGLSLTKRLILQKCDHILAVSQFTKDALLKVNKLKAENITVLNNSLDPFLPKPITIGKDAALQNKYGISKNDVVLMSLTRLSSKELYKGYDQVLMCIKQLATTYPQLKYLLVGNYDAAEKIRLDSIIEMQELQQHVVFAGFIQDDEIAQYYNLADVYVMPSKKEGFGIVFIEAMFYGLPVIAGNKDGSVDALLNGKLGYLVDPDNIEAVSNAIEKVINNTAQYLPNNKLLLQHFSYEAYKQKLSNILQQLNPAVF